MSSHDGTTAWRVIVTPVRIVCANTQRIALSTARASYSIRHTRSAAGKIAEARHALGSCSATASTSKAAAQSLINQTLELDEFQQIIDKVWPTPTDTTVGARRAGIRDRRNTMLRDLFTTAETQTVIRGTRWAGLQAITEYLDHHTAKDDDVRAHRVLTSHSVAERKQRAYDLLATR